MELSNFMKLVGDKNWSVWKFQVTITLKAKGYYNLVEGIEIKPDKENEKGLAEWNAKDCKAQEIIVMRLDQGPLTHVLSCGTAAEIWSKLLAVYEKKSEVSLHLLQQKFFNTSFKEGEDINTFLSRVHEIVTQIGNFGEKITDNMVMTKILMSLPAKYSHFISAWESVAAENQTKEKLTARLLIEEERLKNSSAVEQENSAFVTSFNTKQVICHRCKKTGHIKANCKTVVQQPTGSKVRCHFCNKLGHLKKDCYSFKHSMKNNVYNNNKKGSNFKRNGEDSSYVTTAFVGGASSSDTSEIWYLDTGASEHLCCNRNLFATFEDLTTQKLIRFGSGDVLKATGVGNIHVKSKVNDSDYIDVVIYDVLYVPGMFVNLFSASTTMDKGFRITFDKDEGMILNVNNKVCATAFRVGKLFQMNFQHVTESEPTTALLSSESSKLEVWHQKLAHQNILHVKQILSSNNIKFTGSDLFCTSCVLGKQQRKHFPKSSFKSSKIGELIHADLCGPMEVQSIGGAKYFLLLKDDYSHYRFVYFIHNKSEVFEKLRICLNLIKNQTGSKIKVLRTDGGGEFVNSETKNFLKNLGIIHEVSTPYCPEQNGRVEREMRTVVEAARTMLVAKNMDKSFWAEAVNTATFVINRTGTSTIPNKTPYELWTGKSFDIKWLQVFGSKAYVHIAKVKRQKWDDKSKSGIFVGYCETTKGYRIYKPNERTVEISCNVVFDHTEKHENENLLKLNYDFYEDDDNSEEDSKLTENYEENKIGTVSNEENEEQREYLPVELNNLTENGNPIDEAKGTPETIIERESNQISKSIANLKNLRPRDEIRKPKHFDCYETSFMTYPSGEDEPTTYTEAMQSKNSGKWKDAISKELATLKENNTWTVTEAPDGSTVIDTKWIFKKKMTADGKGCIFKARLVARGFQQTDQFDFSEIYAPVAKLTTLRILIAVANHFSMEINQMDVTGAFLYGDIEETVYLSAPSGLNIDKRYVLKLNKAIYGLKRSPKNWNDKFNSVMEKEGLNRSQNDSCLYYKTNGRSKLYVLIYVDDLILIGDNTEEVKNLKQKLNENFKMKDIGPVSTYLGIKIEQNLKTGITTLSQTDYLKQILEQFGMSNCKPVSTPMDANFKICLQNAKSGDKTLEKKCRSLIGCLMYAMLGSRPDLCYPISYLSRFQDKASEELWTALKRVLRYIKGTLNLKLVYKREGLKLQGFADADWAGDLEQRRSTSGYMFMLGSATLCWSSKRQVSVALSSTEAEYVSLSTAVTEACWLKKIFQDLNITAVSDHPITIFEDNQSAIKVATSTDTKRLKHVDVRFHHIKGKAKDGTVNLKYISTQDQLADLFTKPLGKLSFHRLREGIGLCEE